MSILNPENFKLIWKCQNLGCWNPQIKIIFLRIWASYILKFQDWGSWILNFKKGVIFEDLSILYPELSGFRILKSSKITPFLKIQDSGSSILRMWKSWLYITWRPFFEVCWGDGGSGVGRGDRWGCRWGYMEMVSVSMK